MKRLSLNDPTSVGLAVEALRNGDVVVVPTDTLYGFSAALDRRDAIDRIVAIKRSQDDRRFILLADSAAMVACYVAGWGATSLEAMTQVWPAPLTGVFVAGDRCPQWVGETVAFRVPRYEPVRAVVSGLGLPIISTSVNRSGQDPVDDADAIAVEFGGEVDMLLERRDADESGPASTLIDFTGEAPRVLRAGGYEWTED